MKNMMITFLIIACIGCKEAKKKPIIVEKSIPQNNITITETIGNFLDLQNGDRITFDVNLTMEHYVRVDTVIVKKHNDTLYVSVGIADKIEHMDDDFTKVQIPWKRYDVKYLDTLSLESFFLEKLNLRHKNDAHTYTAKILTKSDTVALYTYNLAEKGRFVMEYFMVMSNVFPNEKKFKPIASTLIE